MTPEEIYRIAIGLQAGNKAAGILAFEEIAFALAETLCNAITLIDGLIVIGGGVSGAYSLLAPKIVRYMNGTIGNRRGERLPRLVSQVYDLENITSFQVFLHHDTKGIRVPFSDRVVYGTLDKRIRIGKSRLGTSRAISLGAYAIALEKLSALENQSAGSFPEGIRT